MSLRFLGAILALVWLTSACEAPLAPDDEQTAKAAPSADPTAEQPNTPLQVPTERSIAVPSLSVPPMPTKKPKQGKNGPILNSPVLGSDISWPQCPKGMGIPERPTEGQPMPIDESEYVVLGLTNGPSFTPNPCLEAQYQWATDNDQLVSVYAVAQYPGEKQLDRYGDEGPFNKKKPAGRLANTGYQAALFNIEQVEKAGIGGSFIWIDVEPYPLFPWSDDTQANNQVVKGLMRGYTDKGYDIGFYSNVGLWQRVLGSTRYKLPEWRATGQESGAQALTHCDITKSFQGGEPVMVQWVQDNRDQNLTCMKPRVPMGRWFHQPT